ncbi:MAG: hypothetical protein ABFC28_07310 [Rikenellaceae bacterium]
MTRPIAVRKKSETSTFEVVVPNGGTQDRAIGHMPIPFPCIGKHPCLVFFNTEPNQVLESGSNLFPLFPDYHA